MNILSKVIILFLFFSCVDAQKEKNTSKNSLESKPILIAPQYFIPELPGKLKEISGLLIYDDLFWGFNDSGGKDKIYGYTKKL